MKVEHRNIIKKILTGDGGFGKILLANYIGYKVVSKELIETNHEDTIKEARFFQKRNHKNIIDFIGMDLDSKTLVLLYMCFDISPFGIQKQVNSLDGFIKDLRPVTIP